MSKITPTATLPPGPTLPTGTEHVAVGAGKGLDGVQLDDQPSTVEPASADAVNCTVVFDGKNAVQPTPDVQLIPIGELVIVPVPCPTG